MVNKLCETETELLKSECKIILLKLLPLFYSINVRIITFDSPNFVLISVILILVAYEKISDDQKNLVVELAKMQEDVLKIQCEHRQCKKLLL